MIRFGIATLFGGLATALVLSAPGAATAQGERPAQPVQPQAATNAEGADAAYSEAEVEAFANAYIEVQAIQAKTEQAVQSADSKQAAQKAQRKAGSRMEAAIRDAGLDTNTYTEMMSELSTNDSLMQRVRSELQAASQQ